MTFSLIVEEKACEKTAGCRRTEESTVWTEGAEGNEAERTTEKTAAGARRTERNQVWITSSLRLAT